MNPAEISNGLFITLEGGEGSGKTTQGIRLAKHLRQIGYPVVQTKEPGGTDIGQALREIVMSNHHKDMVPETELLIYLADRAQHVHSKIIPAIRQGKIVISDRYHDSSVAYQHFARGVPLETLDFIFRKLTGGLVPTLTFVLDIPPESALTRIKQRGITNPDSISKFEEEALSFHRKVRQGFLNIAKNEPERVRVIDGTQSPDRVFNRIVEILTPILPPIRKKGKNNESF